MFAIAFFVLTLIALAGLALRFGVDSRDLRPDRYPDPSPF